MAIQSRDKLKEYFETNDIPTSEEFGHLIDSSLNLADPNLQIMSGALSASSFDAAEGFTVNSIQLDSSVLTSFTESNTFGNSVDDVHRFTGSIQQSGSPSYFLNYLSVGTTYSDPNHALLVAGDISASGTIYSSHYGAISSSNITSSGNIWAKGYVSGSSFNMSTANLLVGALSSSGGISGSIISSSQLYIAYDATIKGDITSSKTGSFGYIRADKDVSASGDIFAQIYKGRASKQLMEYSLTDSRIEIGTSANEFPVKIFGNITSSGTISASGHLFASASNANGSHDNVVLIDTNTGRLYYTGSYSSGGGSNLADGDWVIGSDYLGTSNAIGITSSIANTALEVRQEGSGDIFRLKKNNETVFRVTNNGSVDIGGDGNFDMQANTSTATNASDPILNVAGPIRIKDGDCRLYLEDNSSANQTVWRIQNDNGTFGIHNTNKNAGGNYGYAAMTVGDHENDGGRIDFNTLNQDNDPQTTLTLRHYSNGPKVGINNTSPTHTLDITGDLNVSGQIYAASFNGSDIKLKENIRDLESSIDIIKKLKPRRFDWKERRRDWAESDPHQFNDIGFIAQEIKEILPEVVVEGLTGPKGEEKYLHVSYAKLTPILVKAIQENQSTLEDLERRLNIIENK